MARSKEVEEFLKAGGKIKVISPEETRQDFRKAKRWLF